MLQRRSQGAARALVVGLVVWLSTPATHAAPEQARQHVRLQLRWQHQFQFAGYYLAVDRGYYRDAGLEVELIEATEKLQPLPEVAAGRAEYGVGSSDLVLARARGQPVVALAAIYQHSPLVLLSLQERGIDSVHDLKGKRVALEHEAADLTGYLKDEGIELASLTLVPHAMNVDDLLAGRVDAMSAYQTDEPFLLQAAGREIRIFSPRAGGIDFYGDTLFTTEQEAKKNPARAEAMRQATLRGWREALADPGAAIDAVLERSSRHSREHLEFEARQSAPLIAADLVELGYMNPGRWQHIASTYAELGLMPKAFELDGFLFQKLTPAQLPPWVWPTLGASLLAVFGILTGWIRAHRLSRALARAGQRWRAFVEASPVPVLIVGDGGHILYQNPRALSFVAGDGDRLNELLARPEVREKFDQARETFVSHASIEAALESDDPLRGPRWLSLSLAACDLEEGRAVLVSITDITPQKNLEVSLRREVDTDALTGALSRRRVFAELDALVAETRLPLALGLLDVDHFKAINDGHGHALGDRVLVELSRVCREELRSNDAFGRIGGEEFLLLLPGVDQKGAVAIAERLRARAEQTLAHVDGVRLNVTASLGLAVASEPFQLSSLQLLADRALYRAKADGRNQVCLADEREMRPEARPSRARFEE